MKTYREEKLHETQTWEEQSGLISFLSSVAREVERFNEDFGFGIYSMTGELNDIDGDRELPYKTGFVVERKNPLMPELKYCLYSLLRDGALYGYIGTYRDGRIRTVKELKPIKNFKKGKPVLYDWMKQLVRASCEKIML